MIQWMLAFWPLVPLPFLDPACTSGISQLTYCWSLASRILKHYFASIWNEHNCMVVWTFFDIALLWDWNENRHFPVLQPLLNFPGKSTGVGCHFLLHHRHTNIVIFKILQDRLHQYMNCELPDVQAGFRKGRGTKDQIANICWKIEKAREFHKNIYFCFIDYTKAFDCVDYNKLWKILKEMVISDDLTCPWEAYMQDKKQ